MVTRAVERGCALWTFDAGTGGMCPERCAAAGEDGSDLSGALPRRQRRQVVLNFFNMASVGGIFDGRFIVGKGLTPPEWHL